ncbi:transglutaminaseTgpA domain-containing protein [Aerosakkonema sp. BLCC-F183]|uniref:transglutaminaseTgpA domain-containing protein n=1 Tax=Aerosakkonema sp. BLCC-F183 TaxID=3342834 RepID=UPI0035BABC2C
MTVDKLRNIPIWGKFRERLAAMPMPEVEESLWLRVLVQALVVVGIIATDVAAETFGTGDSLSIWAVPLSIVGATWSWYRRRKPNIPVKFGIAMGMLWALAVFLSNLRDSLNDTRFVLAQLLIQLQVLHSFDLPRRKDLGYSTAIGLILLGVAATLSQTMAFAPLLLVFFAIALPVLVLDYRSRLGLDQLKINRERLKNFRNFPIKNGKVLVFYFFVILGIGLAIFAFMPRVPGYQIRTFPVSSPIEFKGNFDGRSIRNPGYANNSNGQDDRGTGRGKNKEKGAGELDDTFYYGFNDTINQNLRGFLKPKVVMRVRSQAEGFWRVLAFDRYTGQGWEISRNNQAFLLERPSWTYRFYLPISPMRNRTQEVIQSYTIVSELPNLIPAMSYVREVYFPAEKIAIDPEGTIRGPALVEGVTYTVISEVPYRERSRLNQASTNYPKNIRKYYLEVPPAIKEKVRKLTEEILANQQQVAKDKKPITTAYEKALYLAQYLKQNPNYKLEKLPPFLRDNEDLVEAFLFGYKNSPAGEKITGGYPDHFTTVYTIMLRSIGIPARVVGGFAPGEFNPFTGLYVVKNTDAYLMTEVYFPKHGWFAFDPIPGHPLIPPSLEENQTFTAIEKFWKWVAGWLPSPVNNFLSTVFGGIIAAIFGAIAWFFALFTQGWVGLFTGLLIAIVLGFLGWLAWNGWQYWRYQKWLKKLHPMESIYQEMLRWLGEKGLQKHPAWTPFEYAATSRQQYADERGEAIEEISQAYVSWRYGGESPNLGYLRRKLEVLRKSELRKMGRRRSS